jgi:predicted site-specific integrase-resolvase
MLNKQQAAEFLGVNVRTLERYTQEGKIGSRYEKGIFARSWFTTKRSYERSKQPRRQRLISQRLTLPRQITTLMKRHCRSLSKEHNHST